MSPAATQCGWRFLALHTLLLALTFSAVSGTALATEIPATGAIEEITVTGAQSAINLQLAIDTAESDFYALFNALVDKEFRVSCSDEVVLGSRIKKRVCQTAYQKDILTTAALYSVQGMPYLAGAALKEKNAELRKQATELIQTNAELRQAASRLSDLVDEYNDKYPGAE